MGEAGALIDSNVIVAMVAEAHEHHTPSLALIAARPERHFAVAAHSFAEVYSTLTRRNSAAPFRWPADEAWAAIESVAAVTSLVGLTHGQIFDTVRTYAADGGIGPRLYDRLIGQVAIQYDIPRIVTWNLGHMRDLFPELEVVDPVAELKLVN